MLLFLYVLQERQKESLSVLSKGVFYRLCAWEILFPRVCKARNGGKYKKTKGKVREATYRKVQFREGEMGYMDSRGKPATRICL